MFDVSTKIHWPTLDYCTTIGNHLNFYMAIVRFLLSYSTYAKRSAPEQL